jgi:hypothetical protein
MKLHPVLPVLLLLLGVAALAACAERSGPPPMRLASLLALQKADHVPPIDSAPYRGEIDSIEEQLASNGNLSAPEREQLARTYEALGKKLAKNPAPLPQVVSQELAQLAYFVRTSQNERAVDRFHLREQWMQIRCVLFNDAF